MKKALVILVVLALCVPAMAATVVITDNADGTATVEIDATADGQNIVGLALEIDVTVGGDITAAALVQASIDDGFNIYMDAAYTQEQGGDYVYGTGTPIADKAVVGEVAISNNFAVSAGALNGEAVPGADGALIVNITVTVDGDTTITVQENGLRGGIVLADGSGADITNGIAGVVTGTITVPPPVGCKGDITEDYLTGPALVNGLDLSAMVGYLTPFAPLYSITPVPPGDEKYDINIPGPVGDNIINGLDLSALVGHLTPFAPLYSTTNCIP